MAQPTLSRPRNPARMLPFAGLSVGAVMRAIAQSRSRAGDRFGHADEVGEGVRQEESRHQLKELRLAGEQVSGIADRRSERADHRVSAVDGSGDVSAIVELSRDDPRDAVCYVRSCQPCLPRRCTAGVRALTPCGTTAPSTMPINWSRCCLWPGRRCGVLRPLRCCACLSRGWRERAPCCAQIRRAGCAWRRLASS